jgi:hypothetical protein
MFQRQLKKGHDQPTSWNDDFKTWLTFMNAKNPYIREARELLELISQKPEDRSKYAARVEEVRDYYSGLSAEREFGAATHVKHISRNDPSSNTTPLIFTIPLIFNLDPLI